MKTITYTVVIYTNNVHPWRIANCLYKRFMIFVSAIYLKLIDFTVQFHLSTSYPTWQDCECHKWIWIYMNGKKWEESTDTNIVVFNKALNFCQIKSTLPDSLKTRPSSILQVYLRWTDSVFLDVHWHSKVFRLIIFSWTWLLNSMFQ